MERPGGHDASCSNSVGGTQHEYGLEESKSSIHSYVASAGGDNKGIKYVLHEPVYNVQCAYASVQCV